MKVSRSLSKGFTFLELLAALTILAIVIGIAAPAIFKNIERGRRDSTRVQISGFGQALNQFNMDCGFFPSTEQGLNALIQAPAVGKSCKNYDKDGYIERKTIPEDPWKQPYIYESPGKHNTSTYDLSSAGPDKQPGNEDDITNWE